MLACGAINWDTTLFVDSLPSAGEELRVSRIVSVPGGKGANVASSAARILGHSHVGIVGGLGTDDIASRQLRILEGEGVDTSCIVQKDGSASGEAFIIVDKSSGENMILTHMSANDLDVESFSSAYLKRLDDFIAKSEMVVVIDPPLEFALFLADRAAYTDKILLLSPSLLTRRGFASLRVYLDKAHLILLNESEARLLASSDDPVRAGEEISTELGKQVIVTLGSRGCMFISNGKRVLIPPLDLGSYGLRTVSTVGAGDSFLGAFSAFKLRGLDDIESIFLANIAAALKTTSEETRGSPRLEEIQKYSEDRKMRLVLESLRLS
ncbi:MAG TPA: PfkB family carbohydrate kinase [Nitrososphaera sp.]|nr:PfkB family carbohydrate kinase [Nitrososphaera sp.]